MFLIPASWYSIKKIKNKGRGVFAKCDIEEGTVIGDYLGILIKQDSNNEAINGLYDMSAGAHYDILADPKEEGIHLINHSCSNNCDVFPYQGHMLFFALRKIFKGEELSIHYGMYAPYEKNTPCSEHACYCGSEICSGTMHHAAKNFDLWENLIKKQFGSLYKKIPGKYGDKLNSLEIYPFSIRQEDIKNYEYNIFGSENKSPKPYNDEKIPSLTEIRKRIRNTGKQLYFKKIGIIVYGLKDGLMITKNKKIN